NTIQTNANESTIGGGSGNTIQPNATYSTIGGGIRNTIQPNASYSTIGGGHNNTNTGSYSAIPGGDKNVAGTNSFAAGHRAKARHSGSFVWADSQNVDFPTTATNQFLIRASGGVGINKNNPTTALDVNGAVTATAFNTASDRNLKENFTAIDAQSVLDKVVALPVSEWNFKMDKDSKHIGPMAQDFYAAFGTGTDEKHIATVDESGVALAAIQGLNEKVEEKDAEIQNLRVRLEKLEKLLRRELNAPERK
ncbi:MAG: tail fiber domain-containing protein, partial [Verrucomicrobiota bacterium]|nr:tail fiber domain-containing protein [Verrucomicrobiota bacterium]